MPIFATLDAAIALLKRFWLAIPILALSIALLATRATLADAKRDLQAEQTAHQQTVQNYRTAAAERKAADLANVQRVKAEQKSISDEVVQSYEKRIENVRLVFAQRVRDAQASTTSGPSREDLSAASPSSGSVAQASCENRLPAKDALIASEQAVQLDELITWTIAQQEVDTSHAVRADENNPEPSPRPASRQRPLQ